MQGSRKKCEPSSRGIVARALVSTVLLAVGAFAGGINTPVASAGQNTLDSEIVGVPSICVPSIGLPDIGVSGNTLAGTDDRVLLSATEVRSLGRAMRHARSGSGGWRSEFVALRPAAHHRLAGRASAPFPHLAVTAHGQGQGPRAWDTDKLTTAEGMQMAGGNAGSVTRDDDGNGARARDGDVAIRQEFETAKARGTEEALCLFIRRHPDHELAGRARQLLDRIDGRCPPIDHSD